MTAVPHLLILGGTAEAASLAASLAGRMRVTSSLAGRTEHPAPLAGVTRIGGFGGAAGLASWLRDNQVDLVVDATHPFATAIQGHAATACILCRVPRLRLQRPAWDREPGDRWIEVADAAAAAETLARFGGRAFLTIGTRGLVAFAGLERVWLLIRLIAPVRELPALGPHEIILGRGPFGLEAERRLLRRYGISVLVTKASGGTATAAKLTAAREACLPVILVRRPEGPAGAIADSVESAVTWVVAQSELVPTRNS